MSQPLCLGSVRSFAWTALACTALLIATPTGALAQDDFGGEPEQPTLEELTARFREVNENRDRYSTDELQQQVQSILADILTLGNQQSAARDYQSAIQSFSAAVKITGGLNPQPLYFRARAYVDAKEFDAAQADIKELLIAAQGEQRFATFTPLARSLRARAYLETGAVDRALKEAEAAIKADRNAPSYHLNYGEALVRTGNIPAGVKSLTKYIEAAEGVAASDDPEAVSPKELPGAYRWRGQASLALRKFDKAIADFNRAIELDPEDHETYFTKATAYVQQKDYETAAEVLQQAIDHYTPADPDLPTPYSQAILQRAAVIEEIGKKSDDPEVRRASYEEVKKIAEGLLDELSEDDPNAVGFRFNALFRLGIAERLLGDLPEAIKAFSEAIDLNPGFGQAYFRRGICYFYLGEPRLALGDFNQGAAINYDNPMSNLWKGRCHAELGDYQEAIKAFSESVAVSDRYTVAYVHRGLAYLRTNELELALDDLNTAIRLDPTDGEVHYFRGLVYEQKGELKNALDSHMFAIRFSPEFPEGYEAAARLLDRGGRSDLAGQYRNRASRLRADQAAK